MTVLKAYVYVYKIYALTPLSPFDLNLPSPANHPLMLSFSFSVIFPLHILGTFSSQKTLVNGQPFCLKGTLQPGSGAGPLRQA